MALLTAGGNFRKRAAVRVVGVGYLVTVVFMQRFSCLQTADVKLMSQIGNIASYTLVAHTRKMTLSI